MSMIEVSHLSFTHEGSWESVFEDVSFRLDTDWKLGFVGRNGRGKTTFLDLLMGRYPCEGTITASVGFDYFPYPVADPEQMTLDVLEGVCPTAEEWELLRELSLLEVDAEALYRPFSTRSAGERTKALLAGLFLNEGRFLLIDEPTNHLDTAARRTVADYLGRKKGFILVSHDRAFLDRCVDHILSISRASIEVRGGNFSDWWADKEGREAGERARNKQLKREMGQYQAAARQAGQWSDKLERGKNTGADASGLKPDKGHVGRMAAKLAKRAKSAEGRSLRAAEEKAELLRDVEETEPLKLHPLEFYAPRLVEASRLSLFYDGRQVCPPVSFTVERGERVALDGRNGSGKSSLLKLILGENIAHEGTLTRPPQLIVSHVPQETEGLSGGLDEYARMWELDESLFKAILRKLDFSRGQFEKDMGTFSAGQKKKVLIARSLCQRAHLYVWDEPLNFIDVYARMQIEALLTQFKPTMIFVEHDGAFREHVATKVVELG